MIKPMKLGSLCYRDDDQHSIIQLQTWDSGKGYKHGNETGLDKIGNSKLLL